MSVGSPEGNDRQPINHAPPTLGSATPNGCTPGAELPPSIRQDGPIAQQLERANDAYPAQSFRALHSRAVTDLEDTRRAVLAPGTSLEMALSRLRPRCDPVLMYVVAVSLQLQVPPEVIDAMVQAFLGSPRHYRAIFGCLIPSDVQQWLDERAYQCGTNPTAADEFDVLLRRVARRSEASARPNGLLSGIVSLDMALGGFRGLTFISGQKGAGKTTLVQAVINQVLPRTDTAVLVYSFDLSKSLFGDRLLCQVANVDYRALAQWRPRTDDEQERIDRAVNDLGPTLVQLRVKERDLGFKVAELDGMDGQRRSVARGLSFEDIVRDFDELQDVCQLPNRLVVFEMLSRWPLPGDVASTTEADLYRLDVIDRFRQWSRTASQPEGAVVIATTEMRKDATGELSLDDVKGDGRISSDADAVLLLSQMQRPKAPSDSPVPVRLHIAKARDGGQRGDIDLMFDHRHYRFTEMAAKRQVKHKGDRGPTASKVDPYAEG